MDNSYEEYLNNNNFSYVDSNGQYCFNFNKILTKEDWEIWQVRKKKTQEVWRKSGYLVGFKPTTMKYEPKFFTATLDFKPINELNKDWERVETKRNRRDVLEELLNKNDSEIKQMWISWDKGDCSDVGLCEILLFQLIKEHKQQNGEYYDTDYDQIKLRYT